MNILIISNSAPGYHRFFNGLGKHLAVAGHRVEFAVDSPYCRELNELDDLNFKIHEFTGHFLKAKPISDILEKYKRYPLNSAILSEYERADIYNMGAARDTHYYLRLQTALLEFFELIVAESQIDIVIYESVSNAFAHFAWFVCQFHNLVYLGFSAARVPGRFVIIRDPFNEHVPYQATLESIRSGALPIPDDVCTWAQSYLRNIENIVPDYVAYSKLDDRKLRNHYFTAEKLRKLRIILSHINDDHELAFQVGNPLRLAVQMVRRKFLRNFKLAWFSQGYSEAPLDEPYLLYPLHYHPESSTSIMAAAYLDEYEVIRNIAFSLPAGVNLYVKDHPSAYGDPPVTFYRRLAALPNVRVISPFADTKKFIKGSLAVITLTSTVGYEAVLLKKRVFVFGSVFYAFHRSVVSINNPSKLFELFNEHLYCPVEVDDAYNLEFVSAYYMNTFPGVLNFYLLGEDAQHLVNAVAPIVEKVAVDLAVERKLPTTEVGY